MYCNHKRQQLFCVFTWPSFKHVVSLLDTLDYASVVVVPEYSRQPVDAVVYPVVVVSLGQGDEQVTELDFVIPEHAQGQRSSPGWNGNIGVLHMVHRHMHKTGLCTDDMSEPFGGAGNLIWRRKISCKESIIGRDGIAGKQHQALGTKIDGMRTTGEARPVGMVQQFIPLAKLRHTRLAEQAKLRVHIVFNGDNIHHALRRKESHPQFRLILIAMPVFKHIFYACIKGIFSNRLAHGFDLAQCFGDFVVEFQR